MQNNAIKRQTLFLGIVLFVSFYSIQSMQNDGVECHEVVLKNIILKKDCSAEYIFADAFSKQKPSSGYLFRVYLEKNSYDIVTCLLTIPTTSKDKYIYWHQGIALKELFDKLSEFCKAKKNTLKMES